MINTIKQLKHKNRKTQQEFYKKFSVRLFRVAYRYVNNEQDAGSIVNIGFYNIFQNMDGFTYTNDEMLMAWMKKIIVNEALAVLRKKHKYINIDEVDYEISQNGYHTDNNLAAEEYYRMIQNLPSNLRTVFNLYAIEGYSHSEIAYKLGIEESSSRVYLMRARKSLQESLSPKLNYYEK
ncbi:MAG: sigma-70 family RNA polymerase sigma factor [Bacteroidales bacterium]